MDIFFKYVSVVWTAVTSSTPLQSLKIFACVGSTFFFSTLDLQITFSCIEYPPSRRLSAFLIRPFGLPKGQVLAVNTVSKEEKINKTNRWGGEMKEIKLFE